MPLKSSARHSSGISKRPKLSRRSASTPFADLNQRKPIQRSKSKADFADNVDDFFGDRLDDIGSVKSLPSDPSLSNVVQTIQYVRSHMFDELAEDGGFNSGRIADILNFRRSLPSIVTVPHVHALAYSPTRTEREIAELITAGTIKKVVTPGRGTGGSSIGESLVLTEDVESLLSQAKELDQELVGMFTLFRMIGTENDLRH